MTFDSVLSFKGVALAKAKLDGQISNARRFHAFLASTRVSQLDSKTNFIFHADNSVSKRFFAFTVSVLLCLYTPFNFDKRTTGCSYVEILLGGEIPNFFIRKCVFSYNHLTYFITSCPMISKLLWSLIFLKINWSLKAASLILWIVNTVKDVTSNPSFYNFATCFDCTQAYICTYIRQSLKQMIGRGKCGARK